MYTRRLLISCLTAALAVLAAMALDQRADYRVVPLPDAINGIKSADFKLTEACLINYPTANRDMERNAAMLSEYVEELTGMHLSTRPTVNAKDRPGNVTLLIDPKAVAHDEGYRILVTARGVEISGRTPAGVFQGIQVLRKSLPVGPAAMVALPAAQVEGQPRFGYRGMHLDCARHFFGVPAVKRYLDIMALHGMNQLHWHLTDDQGWRIEIKKYPRLAEVGGWRNGTTLGHNSPVNDGIRYGGYYTQDEIRDIVRYAADRYITVIPEVDMPGHMLAALTAYPELGCTGGPYEVWGLWGVADDVLCVGRDHTLQFIRDVLDEVMQLFPGEYIHIGGDESPRVRWQQCPRCQQRIADEGLQSRDGRQGAEARLQGWFTTRVQRYLAQHGRRIIGWDELLGCDVDTTATIMSWTGAEPGARGAMLGHDVIMTPNTPLYFDHYQSRETWNEPTAFGGLATLRMVYEFEPVAAHLTGAARGHILGAQANLWTEYITCEPQAQYMVLPRMAALAELLWMRPEARDYADFMARLPRLVEVYRLHGWTYRARSLNPDEEKDKN
ncbi:MAG: beta-N-acetylhexosaminidase [Muribaculaceae bacterium]|nr:beta-N-acetylhexosaminidase [Muribaculaceae bacterium]